MKVSYKKFSKKFLDDVIELEKEWTNENITYGIEQSGRDYFLNSDKDFFYIALDEEKVIAYITCETVNNNEYNIFPRGSSYLRVNDIYVLKRYRNYGIGEKLLARIEKEAKKRGLKHIFLSTATKDTDSIIRFYRRNGYTIWTTMLYKNTD